MCMCFKVCVNKHADHKTAIDHIWHQSTKEDVRKELYLDNRANLDISMSPCDISRSQLGVTS